MKAIAAITQSIFIARGRKVLLDADLARFYGVTTRRLNEQVRRNASRFPEDFAFTLTREECANLMSQSATSSALRERRTWGGRRKPPRVFTEHGAFMAAAVLNTKRAIRTSVLVVRAFVRLRELVAADQELALRLDALETRVFRKLESHDDAITGLMNSFSHYLRREHTKGVH
jgi:hypothetical protein